MNNIFTPTTWKWIAYTVVAFGLIFIALLLAGWGKKLFKKDDDGKNGDEHGNNPDGTPTQWPAGIDQGYIDRIAQLAKKVKEEKAYLWPNSDRCELCNNILSMREEELAMLVKWCKTQYKVFLKTEVNQYESSGCSILISTTKTQQIKDKLKNY